VDVQILQIDLGGKPPSQLLDNPGASAVVKIAVPQNEENGERNDSGGDDAQNVGPLPRRLRISRHRNSVISEVCWKMGPGPSGSETARRFSAKLWRLEFQWN
jgi:hypothetical protein